MVRHPRWIGLLTFGIVFIQLEQSVAGIDRLLGAQLERASVYLECDRCRCCAGTNRWDGAETRVCCSGRTFALGRKPGQRLQHHRVSGYVVHRSGERLDRRRSGFRIARDLRSRVGGHAG
ncbi:hypothetical protein GCM10027360_66920 [Amycolatopsis echigonensis]